MASHTSVFAISSESCQSCDYQPWICSQQLVGIETESFQHSWPVGIKEDIGIFEEILEQGEAGGRLQIQCYGGFVSCEEVSGSWRRYKGMGLGMGAIYAKDRSAVISEKEGSEWDFYAACCQYDMDHEWDRQSSVDYLERDRQAQ